MARRGDVLRGKRILGFAREGGDERYVVVQSDDLNGVLPTALVVPLHAETTANRGFPLAIPVSAQESGSARTHMAMASSLTSMAWDTFEAGAVGRLMSATMGQLAGVLRYAMTLL